MLSSKVALIIPCFAVPPATVWLVGRGFPFLNAVVISVCAGAVLAVMLVLGTGKRLEDLQKVLVARPEGIFAIVAALFGLYLLYAVATNTARPQHLFAMALYLLFPFLLLTKQRGVAKANWLDVAAILWMWLPLELGLVRRLTVGSSSSMDFHYAFVEGLAMDVAIIAFGAWRGLRGIGYRFEFSWKTISIALIWCVLFAAIAIPLGFAIHFIRYSFQLPKLMFAPATFLGVFLFTAIPEEFLFRGLIQNCLERIGGRRILGLVIASIVFGASHLNNGPPIPNYKYFFMASIAGVFYGMAWQRTHSLTASGLTHALVDTAWTVLFR
jgi:membrane protease YdiL (CAAX protease family)